MRCFVAIELDHALRGPLLRLLRERLPASKHVRWCGENQLHLTLKFLGDVDDKTLSRASDVIATASAGVEPFSIRLSELGCFPGPSNPRVLWCGISDETEGCARWLAVADPQLAELGFKREQREFRPHITLGRSRDRAGADVLRRVLDEAPSPPAREMRVARVVLFESRLLGGGAEYHPVCTARLGA
jgi:2'-5' RNA ligase